MSDPYAPALITRLLRAMSDAELSAIDPHSFQTWPAQVITPGRIIRELIGNERAARNGGRHG